MEREILIKYDEINGSYEDACKNLINTLSEVEVETEYSLKRILELLKERDNQLKRNEIDEYKKKELLKAIWEYKIRCNKNDAEDRVANTLKLFTKDIYKDSFHFFLELIQNADDACASKLIIKEIRKQVYLVANNGRTFDERDLEALCRSGASTKHRKNNTIGYRGIGFKSVVNYSNIVHLYSGDIKATFSKMLTQKEIPEAENVPLIRIPHNFEGNEYIKYIYEYLRNEYTTIFIFEVNNNCLLDEIEMFDSSCMLFLRNIKEIIFDSKSRENVFLTRNNQIEDNIKMVQLIGTEDNQNWLVYNDSKNNVTDIAFKYYDNETVMARENEAVFHSFMPTNNRVNIPLKINGDFSTDPSRTKIVLDTETTDTINNVVELFGKIIEPI